jgi:hypothetical protein
MQKLLGTNSGKNNKSCRIFHNESNKIGFAFFWFFCDFLRILQESAKWLYYLRFTFALGSLESFRFLRISPGSRKTPWKLWIPCKVVLGGGGRCGRWNSGEVRRRGRLGMGVGWSMGAPGTVSALGWDSGNTGGSHGGDGRGEPLSSLLRRGAWQCGAIGDWGSSSGC